MSLEYGVKIKNIEASTLFEYNLGVRDHFEYTNAMFTNSLFHDYLLNNGLKIKNESYTKDIICLEFNYGSRSYEEEIAHIFKLVKSYRAELNELKQKEPTEEIKRKIIQLNNKRRKIFSVYTDAKKHKDLYVKKSKEEIREDFYQNGVYVTYITRNNDGSIKRSDMLHYKMLYRSTGKAKKGSCMFICDRLYKKAHDFIYMGLKLPKTDAPIVEIGAYSSLVASSIVGKIQVDPYNIFVMKDIDSFFKRNVISVETDENKQCIAKFIENYELKNTVFDGQALIDSSIFPSWGDGYVLLRQHMCKMACFNSNIQKFFKDYYGDKYLEAELLDMWGNVHNVKDIKIITTESAFKWLKFTSTLPNLNYNYWCDKVRECNCNFGVVKTAHKSKLGEYQKMSYQMINTLNLEIMPNVVKESVDYIESMKNDNNVFLEYLKDNCNFANDSQLLYDLCQWNKDFVNSSYFKERKSRIIGNYVDKFRSGKVIQNADNLVLCGSPYAMLLQCVGEDIDTDDTLVEEQGTIQCYTNRFDNEEYLAGFRSPHNSQNNILYFHNIYSEKMNKYFNFGKQIIAVNVRHTDVQDRGNGLDFDSDSCYTTNQIDIVNHAKWCYENRPTIVNNVPKSKKHYDNTLVDYADIDNNLARRQGEIGESSNLAQILQTYYYSFNDEKYLNYVCILSVLAQISIDSAKRVFDVDVASEISRIKKDSDVNELLYPKFWRNLKGCNNINNQLKCPMNYLVDIKIKEYKTFNTIPIEDFLVEGITVTNRYKSRKVEELIENYSLNYLNTLKNTELDDYEYILMSEEFDNLIKDIQTLYISKNYIDLMSWLIKRAFSNNRNNSNLSKNRPILLKVLYSVSPKIFLKCFKKC